MIVDCESIHGRRTLRDNQWSRNPFKRGSLFHKTHVKELVHITNHEIPFGLRIASLLGSNRHRVRLKMNTERLDFGWLAGIYLSLITSLYSSSNFSSSVLSSWDRPFAQASCNFCFITLSFSMGSSGPRSNYPSDSSRSASSAPPSAWNTPSRTRPMRRELFSA